MPKDVKSDSRREESAQINLVSTGWGLKGMDSPLFRVTIRGQDSQVLLRYDPRPRSADLYCRGTMQLFKGH